MIKVSIIVPVYNTELYLEKCLDSLVNQTLPEIEVIVVNDGTKDDSQQIIDQYSKRFPDKVVSFIQENQGLSAARNTGIKVARGEYIGFVDSDDWVDKSMYELLYEKAASNDSDMVVCDTMFVFEDHERLVKSGLKADAKSSQQLKSAMISLFPAAWNKIYKRSLFDSGVTFKLGVWYEDVEFMYKLFPHIRDISVVSRPLVFYLQRSGAISKTFDQRLFDYLDNWEGVIEYYLNSGFFDFYKEELEYSCVRYILGTFLKNSVNLESKKNFDDAVNRSFGFIKHFFPSYHSNRYFYTTGIKGLQLLLINKSLIKLIRFLRVFKRS